MDIIQKRDNGSIRQAVSFKDCVVRTKQEFKKESNINNIMAKYEKTGILGNPLAIKTPIYGDFSHMPTYKESLDMINKVNAEFMRLPAKTRAFFNNDPSSMLDFIQDEKNLKECVDLGLLPKSVLPDVEAKAESSSLNKTSSGTEENAVKPA